jgi:hypothetical protein
MLAEIGKRLGREALAQVASVARPDTILAWYRKLIAYKESFDRGFHDLERLPADAHEKHLRPAPGSR